jgi:hypothetical protein
VIFYNESCGINARFITDLLLQKLEKSRYTWGSQMRDTDTMIRQNYIAALRLEDAHEIKALLAFVRS